MTPQNRLALKLRLERALVADLALFAKLYLDAWANARTYGTIVPRATWIGKASDVLASHYVRVIRSIEDGRIFETSERLEEVTRRDIADRLYEKARLQGQLIVDRIDADLTQFEVEPVQPQANARTFKASAFDLELKRKSGWSVAVISSLRQTWAKLKTRLPIWANTNTQDVAEEAAPRATIVPEDQAETVHHRWITMQDEKVRHAHAAAHGQTVPVDQPFDIGGYKMRHPGDGNLGAPLSQIINCFPAETKVNGDVRAATRHWYDGDLVEVTFASGNKLSGTPNHPVLTAEGWIALGLLNEHSYVVCRAAGNIGCAGAFDVNNIEPTIAQVFDALAGLGRLVRASAGDVNFHGDAPTKDVDIVSAHRSLVDALNPSISKHCRKIILAPPNLRQGDRLRHSLSGQFRRRALNLAACVVGLARQAFSGRLWRHCHAALHTIRAVARLDALIPQTVNNSASLNAKLLSQRLYGHATQELAGNAFADGGSASFCQGADMNAPPGLNARSIEPQVSSHDGDAYAASSLLAAHCFSVGADKIVDIRRYSFSGHVYNLECSEGLYYANGIVVHNCRCVAEYGVMRDGQFVSFDVTTARGEARAPRRPGTKPGSAAPRLPTQSFTFGYGKGPWRGRVVLSDGQSANYTVRDGGITIRVGRKPIASAGVTRDTFGKWTLQNISVAADRTDRAQLETLLRQSVEWSNRLKQP